MREIKTYTNNIVRFLRICMIWAVSKKKEKSGDVLK